MNTMSFSKHIRHSILRNVVSQIGGRFLLSLLRFGIAMIIVRYAGVERFGEYALILSILVIAEWLTDFGTTDIVVRSISQAPGRRQQTMNALCALKIIQAFIGYAGLLTILGLLDFPAHIFRIAAIAGVEIFFYGAILIYRVWFRVDMVMERDVFCEVIGFAIVVPCLFLACVLNAGLEVLVGAFASSRVITLLAAFQFKTKEPVSPLRATPANIRSIIADAWPLGITGLIVCLYETVDPIILSKLHDNTAVGYYSSALRFLLPIVIIMQSIANSVFPVLSASWKNEQAKFDNLLQSTLNASILISASMCVFIFGSAPFLMRLLSDQMVSGVTALKLLSLTIISRSISTVLTPLVTVANHQKHAIWLVTAALGSKILFLYILVPEYGLMGAVFGYLCSELFAGLIPLILFIRYFIDYKLNWNIAARSMLALAVAIIQALYTQTGSALLNGIISFFCFWGVATFFKAVNVQDFVRIKDRVKNKF